MDDRVTWELEKFKILQQLPDQIPPRVLKGLRNAEFLGRQKRFLNREWHDQIAFLNKFIFESSMGAGNELARDWRITRSYNTQWTQAPWFSGHSRAQKSLMEPKKFGRKLKRPPSHTQYRAQIDWTPGTFEARGPWGHQHSLWPNHSAKLNVQLSQDNKPEPQLLFKSRILKPEILHKKSMSGKLAIFGTIVLKCGPQNIFSPPTKGLKREGEQSSMDLLSLPISDCE